jgi:hypothetical protein
LLQQVKLAFSDKKPYLDEQHCPFINDFRALDATLGEIELFDTIDPNAAQCGPVRLIPSSLGKLCVIVDAYRKNSVILFSCRLI